jgi:hypothetical protein
VADNTEVWAKAIFSLAPTKEKVETKMEWLVASKEEQEKKIELFIGEKTSHGKKTRKTGVSELEALLMWLVYDR